MGAVGLEYRACGVTAYRAGAALPHVTEPAALLAILRAGQLSPPSRP
jgi:hypothetical protein